MVKVLVDTDIIIDFIRTENGILPKLFILQSEEKIELFISALTVLELYSGQSSKMKNPHISELISAFHIVDLDQNLGRFTGELKRDYPQIGAFADIIIGASALYIGAQLATRNRKHFRAIPKLKFF